MKDGDMRRLILLLSVLPWVYVNQTLAATPQYSVTDLGTLPGYSSASYAYGINDSGQVVGYSLSNIATSWQSFLYSGGTIQNMGTLGGYTYNSFASAINNGGSIVGEIYSSSSPHAFLFNNGTMHDLGTFGGPSSYAYGINSSGQVVGRADGNGGIYVTVNKSPALRAVVS